MDPKFKVTYNIRKSSLFWRTHTDWHLFLTLFSSFINLLFILKLVFHDNNNNNSILYLAKKWETPFRVIGLFIKLLVIVSLSYMSDRETVDVAALSANIRIIAESIARQIYNLTEADMPQLFTNGLVGSSWFSNHCCHHVFCSFKYNLYRQSKQLCKMQFQPLFGHLA